MFDNIINLWLLEQWNATFIALIFFGKIEEIAVGWSAKSSELKTKVET